MISSGSEVNGPSSPLTEGEAACGEVEGPPAIPGVPPTLCLTTAADQWSDVYHRLFIRGKCGHISISFVGCTVALLGLMWEVVTVRRRVK